MKQRGRKSATSLEVVNHNGLTERPEPLAGLKPDEVVEWNRVVNDLPADWFRDSNLPVLEGYCRAVTQARKIASLIDDCTSGEVLDVKEYERLLKMLDVQHRSIMGFGTKMRLTQQATYDKERTRNPNRQRKPWD